MENETKDDIFEGFKTNAELRPKQNEIINKNQNTAKHSKKSFLSTVLISVLGILAASLYFIKKHLTRGYIAVFSAVIITVSALLVIYFSSSYGAGNSVFNNTVSKENLKDLATEYAEKLAVFDYEGIADMEYIKTKDLVETVEKRDFTEYYESNYSAQSEILGTNPQIEINNANIQSIGNYEKNSLGAFFNDNFDIVLSNDVLDSIKTVFIDMTAHGNGNTMSISKKLYLIPCENGNRFEWKILDSVFI